jgi:hypothetical protein
VSTYQHTNIDELLHHDKFVGDPAEACPACLPHPIAHGWQVSSVRTPSASQKTKYGAWFMPTDKWHLKADPVRWHM